MCRLRYIFQINEKKTHTHTVTTTKPAIELKARSIDENIYIKIYINTIFICSIAAAESFTEQ